MCCLALGPVSTTSSSQLMYGFSTVNVEPSFLVTMSPAARYSAERVLMVASRMSSTGALDSFFLPFIVISLPFRVSPSTKVWRQAPSTCLWETAVRLLLGYQTEDDSSLTLRWHAMCPKQLRGVLHPRTGRGCYDDGLEGTCLPVTESAIHLRKRSRGLFLCVP